MRLRPIQITKEDRGEALAFLRLRMVCRPKEAEAQQEGSKDLTVLLKDKGDLLMEETEEPESQEMQTPERLAREAEDPEPEAVQVEMGLPEAHD